MATNLISQLDKSDFQNAFADLHETFARNIKVIYDKTDIVVTPIESFNFFSDDESEGVQSTPEEFVIRARIQFDPKQTNENAFVFQVPGQSGQSGGDVKVKGGIVRIKVELIHASLIENCDRVIIDGFDCYPITGGKFHGIVDENQFVTFYLTKRL